MLCLVKVYVNSKYAGLSKVASKSPSCGGGGTMTMHECGMNGQVGFACSSESIPRLSLVWRSPYGGVLLHRASVSENEFVKFWSRMYWCQTFTKYYYVLFGFCQMYGSFLNKGIIMCECDFVYYDGCFFCVGCVVLALEVARPSWCGCTMFSLQWFAPLL